MGYHFREQESFVRIVELTPALRKRIEATIEHLLSILDQFDGDENLEDEAGGEPWLGWPEGRHPDMFRGPAANDDREQDNADWEDGGDDEPTLGAPERHPVSVEYAPLGVTCRQPGFVRHVPERSQEHWADGLRGDHEREEENEHGGDVFDQPHDGETDSEPDLGWTEEIDQSSVSRFGKVGFDDLEEDEHGSVLRQSDADETKTRLKRRVFA